MSEKNPKPKTLLSQPKKKKVETEEANSFDFGGFPKNIKLTKNLGCGG